MQFAVGFKFSWQENFIKRHPADIIYNREEIRGGNTAF